MNNHKLNAVTKKNLLRKLERKYEKPRFLNRLDTIEEETETKNEIKSHAEEPQDNNDRNDDDKISISHYDDNEDHFIQIDYTYQLDDNATPYATYDDTTQQEYLQSHHDVDLEPQHRHRFHYRHGWYKKLIPSKDALQTIVGVAVVVLEIISIEDSNGYDDGLNF